MLDLKTVLRLFEWALGTKNYVHNDSLAIDLLFSLQHLTT